MRLGAVSAGPPETAPGRASLAKAVANPMQRFSRHGHSGRLVGAQMVRKASSSSCLARWGIAAGAAAMLMTHAAPSSAEEIEATPKGIVGGALLGGEVVMLVEAAFGVKSGWVYILSGVAGAAGGGFVGSLIEKDADPKVSA